MARLAPSHLAEERSAGLCGRETHIQGTVTYTCSLRRFTANTAKPSEGAASVCPFNFKSQDEDTSLQTNGHFTNLGIRSTFCYV